MTPLSEAHAELRLFVEQVERRAAALAGVPPQAARWQDHRTEMIGDLWVVLEGLEKGLGRRLIVGMFPEMRAAAEPQLPGFEARIDNQTAAA